MEIKTPEHRSPDETLRVLVKRLVIAGGLFILFGYGQFLLFFGLDALGVVEIGNGLGHGLLLFICVALGLLILLLALILHLIGPRQPPGEAG